VGGSITFCVKDTGEVLGRAVVTEEIGRYVRTFKNMVTKIIHHIQYSKFVFLCGQESERFTPALGSSTAAPFISFMVKSNTTFHLP